MKLRDVPKDSFFTVNYLPGIKLKAAPKWSGAYAEIEYNDGTLKPYYNMFASHGSYIWLNDNQDVTVFVETDHSIFGWNPDYN